MKILITGGRGQLGTELFRCFERGYTELGTPNVLKQENDVRSVDVDELDITDMRAVRAFFENLSSQAKIDATGFVNWK